MPQEGVDHEALHRPVQKAPRTAGLEELEIDFDLGEEGTRYAVAVDVAPVGEGALDSRSSSRLRY